ncbi:chemotaxis protein CheW, partial [Pseudomonas aeruginosa]|uniref:chemotaxis protein CheW n=1 Tax=Pseudomonas aeruginosa TaxID=287 RepID=UPI003CC5F88E
VVEHLDVFAGLIVDEVFGMQDFPVDTFSEQLPPLEAALEAFIHGVFHREQPWLVFSPQALAQHQGFLDVAV